MAVVEAAAFGAVPIVAVMPNAAEAYSTRLSCLHLPPASTNTDADSMAVFGSIGVRTGDWVDWDMTLNQGTHLLAVATAGNGSP